MKEHLLEELAMGCRSRYAPQIFAASGGISGAWPVGSVPARSASIAASSRISVWQGPFSRFSGNRGILTETFEMTRAGVRAFPKSRYRISCSSRYSEFSDPLNSADHTAQPSAVAVRAARWSGAVKS